MISQNKLKMENKIDYKDDIIRTRYGCLGSSDATMIAKIANVGAVSKQNLKRLSVVKGLVESKDGFKTKEMIFGDYIENKIFEYISASNNDGVEYVSNPLWVSDKYSKKNVKLISHPDIVKYDENEKTIDVYEVKATKYDIKETRHTYNAQLYVHDIISKEIANKKNWKQRLFLVHYDTNGIDDLETHNFEPERITVSRVKFKTSAFDVEKGMTIINDFLETFESYYEEDEIDANLLPEKIKSEFDNVVLLLQQIKEHENKVNEFKERLYEFMVKKEIKSVKNNVFTITRVDPSESKSFDSKRFLEDYEAKYPRKAKKLKRDYEKTTKRKGYAKITVKDNK